MRGILFDLDGTLLDIDLGDFFERYFGALGPLLADITGHTIPDSLAAVSKATEHACLPHPGLTNEHVWTEHFERLTSHDLTSGDWERIDEFYRDIFPLLRGSDGPRPGAHEALEAALATGAKVAIATNPIFPRAAIHERMRWAGIDPDSVDLVTTYETMHACKPLPGYFTQVAAMLGVEPSECLMIGDDPILDMSAADVGMRTYYVGGAPLPPADYAGTLAELTDLLRRTTQ